MAVILLRTDGTAVFVWFYVITYLQLQVASEWGENNGNVLESVVDNFTSAACPRSSFR